MANEFTLTDEAAIALSPVAKPIKAYDVTTGTLQDGTEIVGLYLELAGDMVVYPFMTRNDALGLIRKLRQATKKRKGDSHYNLG